MDSEKIYQKHGQEMYFFILKKVSSKRIANDIFQSSFLKIHKNTHQLRDSQKLRAWVFQICRSEISNYFYEESIYTNTIHSIENHVQEMPVAICCFDRFIDELPKVYKEVIEETFIVGKKQEETAKTLGISLANVKARIRRSKALLKERFQECCKYQVDTKGQLFGEPQCCEI